ncbi:hypothetical protein [Micromonospora chersina]|uniref:hypothetical protein n=1 Tax=Micromonospora chersina TaxID=47854 RepID=UPI0037202B5A
MLLAGQPNGLGRALLMLAGWVINLAAVEWALRRRPTKPTRSIQRRADAPAGALASH